MRRFGSLIAAGIWLLVSACRDAEPPPRAPAGAARSPDASHTVLASAGNGSPTGYATLPPSGPVDAKRAESGAHLAQRFARARPLGTLSGSASYYADSLSGRKTASGAPYDPTRFTAAHRSLPFGTVLRVTRQDGGQVVYVRVTDRGPFGSRGRILDLSRAAATELGMIRAGVVKVRADVLEYGPTRSKRRRRR